MNKPAATGLEIRPATKAVINLHQAYRLQNELDTKLGELINTVGDYEWNGQLDEDAKQGLTLYLEAALRVNNNMGQLLDETSKSVSSDNKKHPLTA